MFALHKIFSDPLSAARDLHLHPHQDQSPRHGTLLTPEMLTDQQLELPPADISNIMATLFDILMEFFSLYSA